MSTQSKQRVFEILPNVYGFQGGHGTFNTYAYLVGGAHPILVDTIVQGYPTNLILPFLKEQNIVPERIVLTHAHADHIGGLAEVAAAFPQARVGAHAADAPWIESTERYLQEMYRDYARAAGFTFDETRLDWVRTLIGGECPVTDRLESGQVLDSGEYLLEVVHVPGHSRGHIALVEKEHDFAIVGDAVLGPGVLDRYGKRPMPPLYTDPETYLASLKRIESWNVPLMLTGHVPLLEGLAINKFLTESEDFVSACDDEILRMLAKERAGLPFSQIVQGINDTLGPYTLGVGAFWSVLANLQALERRRVVTEEVRENDSSTPLRSAQNVPRGAQSVWRLCS